MPGTFTYTPSTKVVQVTGGTSGAPADFPSFYAADRAGTGTSLLAATAPGSSVVLTYPVRPVELLAIVVKFIVASKTTETDYLFITGTDAWDAAQTESINVSAGNGSYTSTKKWRTITNIDCSDNAAGGGTVWANGTIAVTQDIWGVVWKLGNATHDVWKHSCRFNIGDGSTSTFFAYSYGVLISDIASWSTSGQADILYVSDNATFRTGIISDVDLKRTAGSVLWFFEVLRGVYEPYAAVSCSYLSSAVLELANTVFSDSGIGAGAYVDVNINGVGFTSSCKVWNCTFYGSAQINGYGDGNYYNNSYVNDGRTYGVRSPSSSMTADRYNIQYCGYVAYFTWGTEAIELWNVYARNCGSAFLTYHCQNTYHGVVNADVDNWNNSFVGDTINFKLYRRYTVNLKVVDKAGTPIENAIVRLANKNGVYSNDGAETRYGINDELTDSNGEITEQVVSRGYYTEADATLLIDLSPHILTVSKLGYQTLVIPNITIDKIDWTLELQPIDEPPAPWEA